MYVTLSSDGFQKKYTVHNLVADAFLGECPAGHEIRHRDGDSTHNELSNLEYITHRFAGPIPITETHSYLRNHRDALLVLARSSFGPH